MLHLRGAVVDDAGAEEHAARLQQRPHPRREGDDDVRDDVRHHHVVVPAELALQFPVRRHVARADGVAVAVHAVERGVLVGDVHAGRVHVAGKRPRRAEPQRRDGEDTAAAAEIEYLFAAADQPIQRGQAQARRRVAAGAKGQPGVEDQFHAGIVLGLLPLRHDQQPLADLHGLVELLPVVLPVLIRHVLHGQEQRRVFRMLLFEGGEQDTHLRQAVPAFLIIL